MEINGIAHVMLTVRDMGVSRPFYRRLLQHLGLTEVIDTPDYLYFVGARTAVGLRPATRDRDERFDQGRCGLHHVCFRARSRADVDSVHALVTELGATVTHVPEEAPWVPGYYSVLFEDPDGIRLEVNYVPGKGVFEDGARVKDFDGGASGTQATPESGSKAGWIPEGWRSVTSRLVAPDAAALVDFLRRAFGATGAFHTERPTELKIGDSIVMVSGSGPRDRMPAFLYLYVEDVDATFARALETGGVLREAPQDLPYGDRRAMIEDPGGNVWQIATRMRRG
ncbi:MAG TPA: VOC family protein [Polyangiaceae bacterium]